MSTILRALPTTWKKVKVRIRFKIKIKVIVSNNEIIHFFVYNNYYETY